jgi:hypothetical protein
VTYHPWIGVDFDGTLATYEGWQGTKLGKPIPRMVNRVKQWLAEGKEVRIMTARVSGRNEASRLKNGEEMWLANDHEIAIQNWCIEHIGRSLPVTAEKDFEMKELWDDRAVSVEFNTGVIMDVRKDDWGIEE